MDIEKIRQKIKELRELLEDHNYYLDNSEQALGYSAALNDIGQLLDTLSEEPDKGLEEEISRTYHDGSVADTSDIDHNTYDNIAHHFAEWGAEHLRDSTKMIDKSLEEAAVHHIRKVVDAIKRRGWNLETQDITEAFIAGAEWQASQMPMPEDTVLFNKGVAEGRRLEREDMLKDAVEGRVFMSFAPGHNQMVMADVDLPTNTKVRLIVLKAEEE